MKITILCVGKIKEKYYRDAFNEYQKRLSRYCTLSVCEVEDEKTVEKPTGAQRAMILNREGRRLLASISDRDYCIALAIDGKKTDSVGFSDNLSRLLSDGRYGRICFIIGGSLGLSEEVLRRADQQLSFSDLTFPHQLMRVILAEQIYRAFRIMRGEPYHK